MGEVEEAICRWAGRIAAASCGWLLAVAAFDRRGGWSGVGMGSCAHWLAWRCGIGLRTAREQVATARALEGLPVLRAAFAAGTVSYAKVRAVTRVAEPATEELWLARARRCSAGQVERLVRSYRQANGDPKVRRAARRVAWTFDGDGMLCLRAVLSPDEGARLIAALDAARASLEDTTSLAGDSLPAGTGTGDEGGVPADGEKVVIARDRRRDADALVALADGFLDRPAPGLMHPGHTLTVHLTTQPTPTSSNTADPQEGTAGGTEEPVGVARVGGRGVAVYLRDQGRCQYPGCGHTRWLHLHHLTWWGRGGGTDIDRLLLLCSTHHRAVHDDDISLGRDADGTVTARTVDGRVLVAAPPVLPGPEPAGTLAHATRHIDPAAIRPVGMVMADGRRRRASSPRRGSPARGRGPGTRW
ncbi:HNH endonuclease signature motif containing protein [Frankia sp. ArI3]|uniref:HNH endonuclease n=1 Tax=Frankia sp. ArI3 TaxID=1858 RepID=UPI00210499E9|nr:HNH endonuclease signature motif containing protein [Frankia sp. ArI3]